MPGRPGRAIDLGRITSERLILQRHVRERQQFDTAIQVVNRPKHPNTVSEDILGLFRPPTARKAVIADMELLHAFEAAKLTVPSFLEAGPRAELQYDPQRVRAAIVTTGGLAPGLHCVIHSIVKRHSHTYSLDRAHGKILGVYDSFKGLCRLADYHVELSPTTTEEWLDHGGSKLGNVRYHHEGEKGEGAIKRMVDEPPHDGWTPS